MMLDSGWPVKRIYAEIVKAETCEKYLIAVDEKNIMHFLDKFSAICSYTITLVVIIYFMIYFY